MLEDIGPNSSIRADVRVIEDGYPLKSKGKKPLSPVLDAGDIY
jgi:hypothetical protein